jgi:hypothetical protein
MPVPLGSGASWTRHIPNPTYEPHRLLACIAVPVPVPRPPLTSSIPFPFPGGDVEPRPYHHPSCLWLFRSFHPARGPRHGHRWPRRRISTAEAVPPPTPSPSPAPACYPHAFYLPRAASLSFRAGFFPCVRFRASRGQQQVSRRARAVRAMEMEFIISPSVAHGRWSVRDETNCGRQPRVHANICPAGRRRPVDLDPACTRSRTSARHLCSPVVIGTSIFLACASCRSACAWTMMVRYGVGRRLEIARPPLAHAMRCRTPSVGDLGDLGVGWDGPKATARSQHISTPGSLNARGRNLCQLGSSRISLSACSEELANLICSLVARIALATTT